MMIIKKLPFLFLHFSQLYLIEYMDKTQEFVTFGSIRPCNKNSFCSEKTLMQKYLLEDQEVILQVSTLNTLSTWV